jgi:hypothetical protein
MHCQTQTRKAETPADKPHAKERQKMEEVEKCIFLTQEGKKANHHHRLETEKRWY